MKTNVFKHYSLVMNMCVS